MKLKKLIPIACLIAVLVGGYFLRSDAFYVSHWRGDQSQYITLAMKLDRQGFSGYNLRDTRISMTPMQAKMPILLASVTDTPGKNLGDYLQTMSSIGLGYYDEPLHMRAPLFPYVLMWTHRWFAEPNQPFVVSATDDGEAVTRVKPKAILQAQFWAAIVPLVLNLLIILVTCLLAWEWFPNSKRIGIYAGLMMAVNPLSILLSHRILSESLSVFLVTLSVYVFFKLKARTNLWGASVAGFIGGLAVLANQRSGFILIIMGLYTLWLTWREGLVQKGMIRSAIMALVNRPLILYTLGLFLISGNWFYQVYSVYGHPLHMPLQGIHDAHASDVTGWFQALLARPHVWILFSFGTVFIFPCFALALATWKKFYKELCCFRSNAANSQTHAIIFAWIWILIFYLEYAKPWFMYSVGSREHRYFFTVYPAIAALAGWGFNELRLFLKSKGRPWWVSDGAPLLLIGLSAWYAIPMAMERVYSGRLLF